MHEHTRAQPHMHIQSCANTHICRGTLFLGPPSPHGSSLSSQGPAVNITPRQLCHSALPPLFLSLPAHHTFSIISVCSSHTMALCDPLSHQRRNPPPLLPGKTNLQSARLRHCLPAVCDAEPPFVLLFIYDPWTSSEGHYERDYTAKRLGSDPTLITHS